MNTRRVSDWSRIDVVDALRRIPGASRENGNEVQFQECPYCGKSDWRFSVNVEKKVYSCLHANSCGARGTLFKLLTDQGIISPITKALDKPYTKPPQNETFTCAPEFTTWYAKERGINAETLAAFKVNSLAQGDKRYIVYSYLSQNGEEINRKYRNALDKGDMRTVKGAEQGYYGCHLIDQNNPRLLIVSGEDDAHALYQMGLRNVVSVPFGDKTYSPSMEKVNARFKEIILLFDADEPGQEGSYHFAMKAGLAKCRNVVLPFKDARDCLREGLDIFAIEALIREAKPFTCEDILQAHDLKASTVDSIYSPSYIGVMLPCAGLNKLLGGIRLGELTTIIAHTGMGKTTFALNVVWWSVQAGMKAFVLSFENSPQSALIKLVEIGTTETIRRWNESEHKWEVYKPREWLETEIERMAEREIYFLNRATVTKDGYLPIEKLINIIEYAVKFHDVNIVLIDHLHFFLNLSGERNPVHKIDETMRAISQASQRLNIHTLLVVHPSKTQDDRGGLMPVGLNSAKGASSIQQESFNFFTITRKGEGEVDYAKVDLLKNRTFGRVGDVGFRVLENGNTFIEEQIPLPKKKTKESSRAMSTESLRTAYKDTP